MTLGWIPETWTGGIAAGDHPHPAGGAHPHPAAGTAACAHLRLAAATVLPGLHCCGQLCVHQSSKVALSCSSAANTLRACLLLSRRVHDARPLTDALPARKIALHGVVPSTSRPSRAALLVLSCFYCQHVSGPAVQPLAVAYVTTAFLQHSRWQLMQHALNHPGSGRRPPSPRGVRRPLSPRRRSPPGSWRAPPARGRTPPRRRTRSPPSKVDTAVATSSCLL